MRKRVGIDLTSYAWKTNNIHSVLHTLEGKFLSGDMGLPWNEKEIAILGA